MTSLLARPDRTDPAPAAPRPLALIATAGGVLAALGPVMVLLAMGVVGWFLSDAGAHGAPRDGMRTGALAWLAAHGSGLVVQGVTVSVVPLGVSALCAWTVWRLARRVGEAVAGHGPDAHSIADGERDWTVPMSVGFFFTGYAVVAVVVAALASGPGVSTGRVVQWSLGLTVLLAAPAIAAGSGRAAGWLGGVPLTVRAALSVARSVLVALLLVSLLTYLLALLLGFGDAATMTARLHPSPAEAGMYTLVNAAFVPNAALFTGSYLLGPGFALGVDTIVSPGAVVLGPLPLFPLLAALPANATPGAWVGVLLALPPLVAAVAAVRALRLRARVLPWDQATLAACSGGILAGVAFAALAALAGGAVGPGRMQVTGVPVGEVLVHAVTACGLGALAGAVALLVWRWLRHRGTTASGVGQGR